MKCYDKVTGTWRRNVFANGNSLRERGIAFDFVTLGRRPRKTVAMLALNTPGALSRSGRAAATVNLCTLSSDSGNGSVQIGKKPDCSSCRDIINAMRGAL
jgi:hypothetical protein